MIKDRWARGLAVMLGSALLLTAVSQASAEDRMERLREQLNLTDDQVTALREVISHDSTTQHQIFQSLRQAQADLRQLALNGAEEIALQQKTAEIEALMAHELQLRVQRLQRIAPILTPEQRAKFAQLPHGRRRTMKGGSPGQS